MKKPRLLGVPAKPEKTFPLIELIGTIDSGKKAVAQLLSRMLGGIHIEFPNLDLDSDVGRSLFSKLLNSPDWLEENPYWWVHMQCCGLLERREELELHLKSRPVVVTNYVTSTRIWAKASAEITSLAGWTPSLPQPDEVFSIVGEPWSNPGNIPNHFSEELMARVNLLMSHPRDIKVITMNVLPGRRMRHNSINDVTKNIATQLHLKYGLTVNTFGYDRESFARRTQ